MKAFLLATACAAAFAATAAAQDTSKGGPDVASAEVANALETLVVTANRSAQRADRVGQSVTVLDAAAIEASQAVSVADLLVRTPGVSASSNGGIGQVAGVRIRGAEADHTVVVVDGVKLNDPSHPGGGYNFGNLLIGDIARIEVLRGAQSTLWGSQAVGGVVNIVTAQPTEPFAASLDVEGGSMSTGYLRAGVGGANERIAWRVAAGHFTTDGVSAYRQGAERDGYRNTGLSGRLNLRLTEGVSADLRAVYSRGRTQFDGFPPPAYAFADTAEYGRTADLVTYAGLNVAAFDGRLRNRLGYGYTRTEAENRNPDQAATTLTFDSRGRNRRYEYQGVFDIAQGWNAVFGAEREESRMRAAAPSDFDPTPPVTRAAAAIDSLYGQVQGEVAPGLTLTGGLRHDDHETFGSKTLGQAAAAWSLNDGATVLRASFGQGFKAPTLYQLHSEYGNAGLRPETADGWDAGVEQSLLAGAVKVSAVWFGRKTDDQIDFVSCPWATTPAELPLCFVGGVGRFGYYDNVARTKAKGVELSAVAKAGPLAIEGGYTWTRARNDVAGDANYGRALARRPEHQANLSVGWTWFGADTAVELRHVGAAFDDAGAANRLKSYTLVDLRASYPLNETLSLYGRIENLTDEDYQTTGGYGSPGRAAYVGVRARF